MEKIWGIFVTNDQFWGTLVATLVVGFVYYKIQGPSGGILKGGVKFALFILLLTAILCLFYPQLIKIVLILLTAEIIIFIKRTYKDKNKQQS